MNTFTKIALVLFLTIVLPITVKAQKCDLDIDELDQFTKEYTKAGTNSIGGKFWHWKLTLKRTGNSYGWEMQIKWGKHFQDELSAGDTIYCKLENDNVIKLIPAGNFAPSHTVAPDGFIITTYLPKGELSEADVKSFSEAPLSAMRVILSGTKFEPNISSKQGSAIQNIAQCILKD